LRKGEKITKRRQEKGRGGGNIKKSKEEEGTSETSDRKKPLVKTYGKRQRSNK
jgi:hypothetical protein